MKRCEYSHQPDSTTLQDYKVLKRSMTLQEKLLERYGNPLTNQKEFEDKWLTYWDIPLNINTHIPALPNKLYCNIDAIEVFEKWFQEMINHGVYKEIKTFDGCFNPRYIRGSKTKISNHAFGLAIDFNASQNKLGYTRKELTDMGLKPFSEAFIMIAENCHIKCGANYKARPDLMHFEFIQHL